MIQLLDRKAWTKKHVSQTLKNLAEEEEEQWTMNPIVALQTALDNALVAPDDRVEIGKLPNQEFDEPPSDEEIVSFVKELGYKGDIRSVTEILTTDDTSSKKKSDNSPYPQFPKPSSNTVISKDKSISMRNQMFMHIVRDDSVLGTLKFVSKSEDNQVYGALIPAVMINKKIRNFNSYKTYLAFATRATTPKKARKWKKPSLRDIRNE
ncbi:hypothetical protein Tco_1042096 [Tanacetum coccineum]|uniref:Uncharacterized protein n=1 Tax=Tanacetum coccineum TaxID=301880 RepID=A0ABQ5GJJ1_9ASTR